MSMLSSSSSSASSGRKVRLQSSDGEMFEVEEAAAKMSLTIEHLMEEEFCAGGVVPLPNVTGKILAMIVEYCKKHIEPKAACDGVSVSGDIELKQWDAEFVKVDQDTLFDLILAANYLNINSLLDLSCQTAANLIRGKSPRQIRKVFGIKNDFITEEEEELHRENHWAYE